jgi:hypothetical protein
MIGVLAAALLAGGAPAGTGAAVLEVGRFSAETPGDGPPAERNIVEDYRKAFGEEPPMISGVAIMTDTDNTGESVTAYYGDIRFRR